MADRISDIEDLMIPALKEGTEATVETRSVALTETELKTMLGKAPFIYIEYAGGSALSRTESGEVRARRLEWNLFVAARNLRSKKDAQRGSYELLTKVFSTLDSAMLVDTDTGKRAGPFSWSSEAAVFVADDGGTVYQSVFTLIEPV